MAEAPAPPPEAGPNEASRDPEGLQGEQGRRQAGEEGCWCCNSTCGQETLERKGLEVKFWVVVTENECVEKGKGLLKSPRENVVEGSGPRCTGSPAKSLHDSWDGRGLCFPEISLPTKEQSPCAFPWRPAQLPVGCAWAGAGGSLWRGREETTLACLLSPCCCIPVPVGRREHIPESEFSQGVWMGPGRERPPRLRTNTHRRLPCSLGFCSDPWLQEKLASFWPHFLSSAPRESLPQRSLPLGHSGPGPYPLQTSGSPSVKHGALCNISSNLAALRFISPSPPQALVPSPLFHKGERKRFQFCHLPQVAQVGLVFEPRQSDPALA